MNRNDRSWNPWHGCRKCSEGGANCYMFFLDKARDRDGGEMHKNKTDANLPIKKDRHVTAFIGKEGYKKEVPQIINAKSLDATAKTESADTSVNTVPQDSNSVNEKFSDRPTDSLSNRSILANALENTIDTSTQEGRSELEALKMYHDNISTLRSFVSLWARQAVSRRKDLSDAA